jgi:dipeptidyl aminopeptidase/acylaminoacyl peptidase
MAAALSAVLAAQAARAAEPPLNESVRNVRDLRDVALSPDAKQVAAVFTDSTADGGRTHVWLLGTDGKSARQVTFSTGEDEPGERRPVWASDGASLYLLARRGKADRLYRLSLSGGEAEALRIARPATGAVKSGWSLNVEDVVDVQVRGFEVSPDSRWIAVIAGDGETAARTAQVKKKDDAVQLGKDDQRKSRLYLVEAATGQAHEVDLPDDVESARFGPGSDELVAVTAPAEQDLGPAARVWRAPVAGGAPVEITGLPRTLHSPAFTAGGLVYMAQCEQDAPPGCNTLFAYDFASRASRALTGGMDGSPTGGFVVEPDGRSVVVEVISGLRVRPARIDVASGKAAWVDFPEPVARSASSNPSGSGWAVIGCGPTQPCAAYFTPSLGQAPVKLAGPALVPADWPETPSRTVTWNNAGLDLEGLLYLPKADAGARTPLVVLVHGGPSGAWTDSYSNLAHLLVAQGWAVFLPNPRGSLGHGAAFEAANKNDLGGEDYRDIMTGVDTVLARYPVDPERMALIGYSYGGEMAGFVEGRTNRFKALVSGAPVIDQFSEYGTEDASFYDRWYYGKPWEHFADAWRQSPLARVGQAKTPMLLVQGVDDPTDPLGQSLEMRRAMLQVGAPVTMISYPRETHATLGAGFAAGVTREPWHGQDLRRRMIQFIADAFAGKPTQ